MRASLRALLEGLIDYAGLFPPAKLPLPEALANYQRYREGPDAWMLGRFVCPASRLNELPPGDMRCSALARGGDSPEAFLAALDADLDDIRRAPVAVDMIEAKVPEVGVLTELLRRTEPMGLALFVESADLPFPPGAGFKLRAGGLEASAFPPARRVARILCECVRSGVRFKATAGLHHALPRPPMHGFVNLFVAGVLAHARGLSEERVVELLEDSDSSSFAFTESDLRWRDVSATTEEVRQARERVVMSFGSCSFDEPRDELVGLGWDRRALHSR